ncbi:MAG: hypothetical protein JXR83_07685 [Deltaproteobacteria bacterium]|nr:hypothetical protein [Deltaproteobacteria bacterium]
MVELPTSAGMAAAVDDTDFGKFGGERLDTWDVKKWSRAQKIDNLGKNALSTLYMLVRNVKLHPPDNEIFIKPLEALRDMINTIVAADASFNLQAVETTCYLNGRQLRLDFTALDNIRYLTEEFKNRGVGGFAVQRNVTVPELRDFISIFSAENRDEIEEDRVGNKRFANMKLGKFVRIKETLAKMEEDDINEARNVDRKKYAMLVYGRSVYFMRMFLTRIRENGLLPTMSRAGRLVQDIVDICFEQRTHFLGMTTSKSAESYLEYHSVNTCLLSVVLGTELGMNRIQLHELGMAAIFHDIGMAEIPADILTRRKGLSKQERRVIDLYPLHTVKTMLRGRFIDRATLKRMVAAYESKVDYSLPMKDKDGNVKLMLPKIELSVFGKIVAICATYDALTSARPFREAFGPEVAMTLMVGEMRYKFDPHLLRVFMKVMAIQPVKVLTKKESTVNLM